MKTCAFFMVFFLIGLFTFSKCGMTGAGVQIFIMICLIASIAKKQYADRDSGEEKTRLFYACIFLPAVLLIGTVGYIPKYQWVNLIALVSLAVIQMWIAFSYGNTVKSKTAYIRNILYIIFFIAILQFKGDLPIYVNDF